MYQELTLNVPTDFRLPRTFLSGNVDTNATALRLGAIAYETIVREGQTLTNESLLENLRKEAERTYVPAIADLKTQVSQTETLVATMKSRLTRQEQDLQEIERRVREEERRNREEIVGEKNGQIEELRAQLRSALGGHKTMVESFQTFKEQILKSATGSSTRGKLGEQPFSELLQSAYGAVGAGEEFEVVCVGTEGHQGDIHMKWKGHTLMWETKNYTKNVEKKEVLKFLRDMEENPQVSLGIMVSLHTGIAGHTHAGGFDLEELRDGRICLYITNFSKHEDSLAVLQGLQPFLEAFLRRKPIGVGAGAVTGAAESGAGLEALQGRLGRIEANRAVLQRLVENHIEVMRKYKNSVLNAKKKSEAIWTDVLAGIKEAEHGVKLVLDTLLQDVSEEVEEEKPTLADYVFKHVEWSMYNERETQFLKDTLDLFECGEDFKMAAKEAKEAYKTRGYSEDAVNALRGCIFLDSAWEKGKKDIKGLRLRVSGA